MLGGRTLGFGSAVDEGMMTRRWIASVTGARRIGTSVGMCIVDLMWIKWQWWSLSGFTRVDVELRRSLEVYARDELCGDFLLIINFQDSSSPSGLTEDTIHHVAVRFK